MITLLGSLRSKTEFVIRNNPTHSFKASTTAPEWRCDRCGVVVLVDQILEGPVFLPDCKGHKR